MYKINRLAIVQLLLFITIDGHSGEFHRSLGDPESNRTLLAAINAATAIGGAAKCAAEKPIKCDEAGPGVEVLDLLAYYYDAQFEFIDYPRWGVGDESEGNESIFRAIYEGHVQTAFPVLNFVQERLDRVPKFSFPIGTDHVLCAIMIKNSSLISSGQKDSLNAGQQGPIWAILTITGFTIYFAYQYIEWRHEHERDQIALMFSSVLISMNIYVHSIVILFYLNFVASTIAILLFQPAPKQLPFSSFDDLADAALAGKVKVVNLNGTAFARFTSPGESFAKSDPTLQKYYDATVQGKVTGLATTEEAFVYIEQRGDSAYVTNVAEATGLPNYCDYEVITDSTYPNIPFGTFFSNTTPDWFRPDASLMMSMSDHYEHYLKKYAYPTKCASMRARMGLSLAQMVTVFCMLPGGLIFALIAFLVELCEKRRRTGTKQINGTPGFNANSNLKSMQSLSPDRLVNECSVMHVVQGCQSNEVWVCFRRNMSRK